MLIILAELWTQLIIEKSSVSDNAEANCKHEFSSFELSFISEPQILSFPL